MVVILSRMVPVVVVHRVICHGSSTIGPETRKIFEPDRMAMSIK